MDVLCTFKIRIESPKSELGCIKYQWPYPTQDQDAKSQSETSSIIQSPKSGLKGHGCSLPFKNKIESQNSDHGCIKDQGPYPNQDQDAIPQSGTSSILQSHKSGLEGHGCSFAPSKSRLMAKNQDLGIWKSSHPIQIKIKMPNPTQEPPTSSKGSNQDLNMDVLCTFKFNIESQNSDHGCIKDQGQYPNQDQDAIPQSGTSSILQSPKIRT